MISFYVDFWDCNFKKKGYLHSEIRVWFEHRPKVCVPLRIQKARSNFETRRSSF
jgi:hypothetical protein